MQDRQGGDGREDAIGERLEATDRQMVSLPLPFSRLRRLLADSTLQIGQGILEVDQ